MASQYKAQWVSRRRMNELKKAGLALKTLLLNHLNGFIVIEPADTELGDGAVLSPTEADYELQQSWILDPIKTLQQAREQLGLGNNELLRAGI